MDRVKIRSGEVGVLLSSLAPIGAVVERVKSSNLFERRGSSSRVGEVGELLRRLFVPLQIAALLEVQGPLILYTGRVTAPIGAFVGRVGSSHLFQRLGGSSRAGEVGQLVRRLFVPPQIGSSGLPPPPHHTLYPIPCTLYPVPYILYPMPYSL